MNKRKENLFFTLFMCVLAHSSRDYMREKNRMLVTRNNPLPQYTKRTIWNYYRLDASAIRHIYTLLSRGQMKKREEREEEEDETTFHLNACQQEKKKREKEEETSCRHLPLCSIIVFLYAVEINLKYT